MLGRYRKCYCMNNEYTNNNNMQDGILEKQCQNVNTMDMNMYNTNCNCGFEEEYNVFPDDPMLGQSYVPYQIMDKTFKPMVGLKMGTIFPELVSPYCPGQSMETNKYLAQTNQVKEGCNR